MLAERKHKVKWSPNPCGNLWAKDSSKFGQKMLEKFGWAPGKGLGVNEQGIVDPVRLKCNSTQKGLGYERGKKVEFFQHQEEFNSILSNLNSTSTSDSKETCLSLEQTSKNCKTRVHYHKFTRGKDLSRYSEKDLSCILGVVSTIENNIASSKPTSPTPNDNLQISPSPENLSLPESGDKEKRKKKKRKFENNNEITENNESNKIEINTCLIEVNSYNDEEQTKPNENPLKKNKKKRKYKNLDKNTVEENNMETCLITNESNKIEIDTYLIEINTYNDEEQIKSNENPPKKNRKKRKNENMDKNTVEENNMETCSIPNESPFREQNIASFDENLPNKKKRKDITSDEIPNKFKENQTNVTTYDSNDQDLSNKISKKKKKNKQ